MLQAQGVGVFAVQPTESARTHSDSLDMALHLQQQAGVETIATLTTWDKTIMTLQAELLGAHALGVRGVICTTGSPPVLGDYPAVDGIWEVDSLGLIALLAGLNAGRDSNGLALTTQTSFCVGARVNPGARDQEAEIARARAKVSAGAHFLVSRPVYELDSLLRMVTALAWRAKGKWVGYRCCSRSPRCAASRRRTTWPTRSPGCVSRPTRCVPWSGPAVARPVRSASNWPLTCSSRLASWSAA